MIQNYNGYRVLKEFMENPLKGYKLRELSRNLKLGLPSLIKYVKELEKEGMVELKDYYNTKLYFANRENEKFKIHKIFHNRIQLEESGVISYLERELYFSTIILFGSRIRGEDTEKSDYDIAVFCPEKKNIDIHEYEKKLKAPIQLFVFDANDYRRLHDKKNGLLKNITDGIKLSGKSLDTFREIYGNKFKV